MHYVFYVTDYQLDIFGFDGRTRGVQSHETISWPLLDEYLVQLPNDAEIKLLFDVADENIQAEFLPALLPWEKKALHKRLQYKYRQKGAGLHRFIWSGQTHVSEDGRKSEILITAQLHFSNNLNRLMSCLKENHLLISGVYSAAFMLQEFVKKHLKNKLKLDRTQCNAPLILITRMTNNHYRQCFFYQNQLRLTRVVAFDTVLTDDMSVIQFLAEEATLATRFIYNQNLIQADLPINYVIVDHVNERFLNQYRSSFELAGAISAKWQENNFIDVSNLVTHAFFKPVIPYFGCNLLAELLNRHFWLTSFYSDDFVKKINRFRYIGIGLKLSAAAIFSWLIIVMTVNGFQQYFIQKQQQHFLQLELDLQQQHQDLMDFFVGQESPLDIKTIVDFSDKLQQFPLMGIDLGVLSEIIAEHPSIKVESLSWQVADSFGDNVFNVSLRGVVFPFNGRYEPIRQALQRFEQSLESHNQIQALKLTQKPFNQDSPQTLNMSTMTPRALPFAIEFRMQIPISVPIGAD